eukprot:m.733985 g.733985  ORF g.733985 m.733985 type:complete len:440 (-) comp23077_c0_seq4:1385-2704(-)
MDPNRIAALDNIVKCSSANCVRVEDDGCAAVLLVKVWQGKFDDACHRLLHYLTITFDTLYQVDCSNNRCPLSGYMHKECFRAFEDQVLKFMRVTGRAQSWSEEMRRNNVWTKKGYNIVKKFCKCRCGDGNLRRDINWNIEPIDLNGHAAGLPSDKPTLEGSPAHRNDGRAKYNGAYARQQLQPAHPARRIADACDTVVLPGSNQSGDLIADTYLPPRNDVTGVAMPPPDAHRHPVIRGVGSLTEYVGCARGPGASDAAALLPSAVPAYDAPWAWSEGGSSGAPVTAGSPRRHRDHASPPRGDPGIIGKPPPSALRRLSNDIGSGGGVVSARPLAPSATSVLPWGGDDAPLGPPSRDVHHHHLHATMAAASCGQERHCNPGPVLRVESDEAGGAWSLADLRGDNGDGGVARDAPLSPPAVAAAGYPVRPNTGSTWASPWQ